MHLQVRADGVAEDVHLECSDAGTPQLIKSATARGAVESMVTKLFKCLEKTATGTYKVLVNIVKDVTSCVSKLPTDFFKCLAKLDVPQKVAEIINSLMDTVKCIS